MKICVTCRIEQPEENFHLERKKKDGRHSVCKRCSHEKAVKRYHEHAEEEKAKRKKYVLEHKEEIRAKAKEYYKKQYADEETRKKINYRNKLSYQRNKTSVQEQTKKYRQRTKAYQTAKTRKRQALVLQRLPRCANLEKIETFYEQARELTLKTGVKHEVDHIIPLQGKLVSGFHVEWNLQILTKSENSSKGHAFVPFMKNEQGE